MHETDMLAQAMNRMAGELADSRVQIEVKQRLESEMELANVLQTSMLPRSTKAAQLEIAARMVPASEVGGDYYDVIPAGDACWIGIGDVAGHGLPAGIVMMMMQTAVTALVVEQPERSPASTVVALNRLLYHNVRERLQANEHATFTLFRHDGQGRLRYAGAHESFLVYRRASRSWESLRTSGTWLAIAEDVSPCTHDNSLLLEPGDTLLLYTDGLTEAVNGAGELFGLARLQAALSTLGNLDALSAEQILSHAFDTVAAWGSVQDDDRTALVVRYGA
jgi:serine phosphatase RsbU (regulator of sigma subunit)